MLNDFILFALPVYWRQHLKLCLRLNFQLISFPIPRVLRVEVKKRDFYCQKNCLSNFYFVKFETNEKIVNVNSFTELYHNKFCWFPEFWFSIFFATLSRTSVLLPVFEHTCPSCMRLLNLRVFLRICTKSFDKIKNSLHIFTYIIRYLPSTTIRNTHSNVHSQIPQSSSLSTFAASYQITIPDESIIITIICDFFPLIYIIK